MHTLWKRGGGEGSWKQLFPCCFHGEIPCLSPSSHNDIPASGMGQGDLAMEMTAAVVSRTFVCGGWGPKGRGGGGISGDETLSKTCPPVPAS